MRRTTAVSEKEPPEEQDAQDKYQDVDNYFKRISVPPVGAYFKPQPNKKVIRQLLEEFSKCFSSDKEMYKQKELIELALLLE